jgi:hypothetical protein
MGSARKAGACGACHSHRPTVGDVDLGARLDGRTATAPRRPARPPALAAGAAHGRHPWRVACRSERGGKCGGGGRACCRADGVCGGRMRALPQHGCRAVGTRRRARRRVRRRARHRRTRRGRTRRGRGRRRVRRGVHRLRIVPWREREVGCRRCCRRDERRGGGCSSCRRRDRGAAHTWAAAAGPSGRIA